MVKGFENGSELAKRSVALHAAAERPRAPAAAKRMLRRIKDAGDMAKLARNRH
ncbi:hypothetical protein IZ6_18070 [Terrihabitans soli]|uniref:Uncharacterized protein n=1 Tax=Terrihabitans soli TaxID=708113 RepID=A0A6S6QUY2_9HYPH|nr:hypothetical protein IZ6_18070 [Terrihabitans soli]